MNRSNWIKEGRAGDFIVWSVGKKYVVTNGVDGPVVGMRSQLAWAFAMARSLH